jgi:GTP-binding protein
MLIDRAIIFVRAGRGGDGCVGLRREKFVPRGGPDGGDGGRGGDVWIVADPGTDTLLGFTYTPHFAAEDGGPGRGGSKHGADGSDREVRVPLGTLVYDHGRGDLLADVSGAGDRLVIARGGRGGFGNEHFKTSTNQTPRTATPGEPGQQRTLRLELKLIADVGLVGRPNAGKSTLLRAVSRATPKVADYPFTTRQPHLGIAELPGARRLVVADLPGLIEGASRGAGLGLEFLRHIERTGVLVHVVEVAPLDGTDPEKNYADVRGELGAYSEALLAKPEIIVLNKIDVVPADERRDVVARLAAAIAAQAGAASGRPVLVASGATGEGVAAVLEACWIALGRGEPAGWKRSAPQTA